MNETLFGDEGTTQPQQVALITQYERAGRTLDDLPYTEELTNLCARLGRPGDERGVLDELLRLRKAGKLPKSGMKGAGRVKIDAEHESTLAAMVVEAAGTMGKRDRLPHTRSFDDLLARFNTACALTLDAHDLWRVIARLAK